MATVHAAVRQASSEKVLDAGAKLGAVNTAFPFLGPTSSILDYNAQAFIEQKLSTPPLTAASKMDFADYLAMGTCCHSLDGWQYLSKAAHALLNGARSTALHLAYYSELRAAMSILASAGIGILNRQHFSMDQHGNVHAFQGATHAVAWQALAEWASIPANADRVLQCVYSGGYPAEIWADSCRLSTNRSSIARSWLAKWSCDLRQVRQDSVLRNRASYRVNLTANAYSCAASSELMMVRNICDACISQTRGRMDGLDRVLVYDLCSKAADLTLSAPVQKNDPRLWQNMRKWFETIQMLDPSDAHELVMTIEDLPANSIYGILAAADTSNKDVSGVLCRALLLLRLAMSLLDWQWNEMRLRAAGGRSPWQQTLLIGFAENCNLVAPGSKPPDWVDLSQDHQKAIDEVDEYMTAGFSSYDLWQEFSAQLRELCRLERIALWVAAP